jgi:hypothetical protein
MKWGGTGSTRRRDEKYAYKILICIPEDRKLTGSPWHREQKNIKIDFRYRNLGYEFGSNRSR